MEDLPKEILLSIANLLDLKARRMIRSTNTKWFDFIRIDNFTMYFVRPSMLPSMVDTLIRYPYNIGVSLEKIFFQRKYRELLPELCRLTNLQDLFIDVDEGFSLAGYVTILRNLTALNSLRICTEGSILTNFSKLTHLELHSENPEEIDQIIQQNSLLQSIVLYGTSVDVASLHSDPTKVTNLELLNQTRPFPYNLSKFCNLKRVTVEIDNEIDPQDVQMFRVRGLTALEHFSISAEVFDSLECNTKLTYLSVSNYATQQDQSLFSSWTALQNLRVLKIKYTRVDQASKMDFFTALTALQQLNIRPWNIGVLDYVNRTLTRLSLNITDFQTCKNLRPFECLQNLTIQADSYAPKPDYGPLLVSSNLTRLSLALQNSKQELYFVTKLTTLKCLKIIGSFIRQNKVELPKHFNFKNLTNLESLQVPLYNDTMVTLTNLTRLTLDSLSNYSSKENHDFRALQGMTGLKILNSEFDVPDEAFETVGKLISLEDLSVCAINDAKVKLMTNLTNLKSLFVRYAAVIRGDELTKFTNLQSAIFSMPGNAYHLLKLDLQAKLPYLYNLRINSAIVNPEE
jgi:hypothetical protein